VETIRSGRMAFTRAAEDEKRRSAQDGDACHLNREVAVPRNIYNMAIRDGKTNGTLDQASLRRSLAGGTDRTPSSGS
jgi:hypothetical protein